MVGPSNSLSELLAGKTPEAMYDALYAGRYLSASVESSPPKVLALLKLLVRNARPRPLVRGALSDRLVTALRDAGFLNEAGEELAARDTHRE